MAICMSNLAKVEGSNLASIILWQNGSSITLLCYFFNIHSLQLSIMVCVCSWISRITSALLVSQQQSQGKTEKKRHNRQMRFGLLLVYILISQKIGCSNKSFWPHIIWRFYTVIICDKNANVNMRSMLPLIAPKVNSCFLQVLQKTTDILVRVNTSI